VLQLVASENFALLQDFERVHLLRVLLLNKEYLSIAAFADDFDRAEVAHGNIASACLGAVAHLLVLGNRFLIGSLL
jgi:hypothetical protein